MLPIILKVISGLVVNKIEDKINKNKPNNDNKENNNNKENKNKGNK